MTKCEHCGKERFSESKSYKLDQIKMEKELMGKIRYATGRWKHKYNLVVSEASLEEMAAEALSIEGDLYGERVRRRQGFYKQEI